MKKILSIVLGIVVEKLLDNTFGFFDSNIGGYFGYDANYVKEMV